VAASTREARNPIDIDIRMPTPRPPVPRKLERNDGDGERKPVPRRLGVRAGGVAGFGGGVRVVGDGVVIFGATFGDGVAFTVGATLGATFGAAFGVIFDATFGATFGAIFGATFGAAFGADFGADLGATFGVAFGDDGVALAGVFFGDGLDLTVCDASAGFFEVGFCAPFFAVFVDAWFRLARRLRRGRRRGGRLLLRAGLGGRFLRHAPVIGRRGLSLVRFAVERTVQVVHLVAGVGHVAADERLVFGAAGLEPVFLQQRIQVHVVPIPCLADLGVVQLTLAVEFRADPAHRVLVVDLVLAEHAGVALECLHFDPVMDLAALADAEPLGVVIANAVEFLAGVLRVLVARPARRFRRRGRALGCFLLDDAGAVVLGRGLRRSLLRRRRLLRFCRWFLLVVVLLARDADRGAAVHRQRPLTGNSTTRHLLGRGFVPGVRRKRRCAAATALLYDVAQLVRDRAASCLRIERGRGRRQNNVVTDRVGLGVDRTGTLGGRRVVVQTNAGKILREPRRHLAGDPRRQSLARAVRHESECRWRSRRQRWSAADRPLAGRILLRRRALGAATGIFTRCRDAARAHESSPCLFRAFHLLRLGAYGIAWSGD
jgi:hypothetical protein